MLDYCPDEDGLFSYLQLYYCRLPHFKPIAFIILALWLSLLFSTIGIAASDFLCINLSTLASILGLSESLTGVTFLAFGNGSPDVFSTFAAMSSNSGSLAIGELIGAACFITSVVAGSMALVRPFRVARRSFVRDVGYFIIAGSFSMVLLADGVLHIWECIAMIGLYLFYVVMVVTWHWYLTRQRKKHEREIAARAEFHIPDQQELDLREAELDDDHLVARGATGTNMHGPSNEDFSALEQNGRPAWSSGPDEEDDVARDQYLAVSGGMRVNRSSISRKRSSVAPIRPSLIGALEFQAVLASLQRSRNYTSDPIDLHQYSDEPSPYSPDDSHSIASQPLENTRLLSNASRDRSVSMNDVPASPPLDTAMAFLDPGSSQFARPTEPAPSFGETRSRLASPAITISPASTIHELPHSRPTTPDRDRTLNQFVFPPDRLNASNYQNRPVSSTRSPRNTLSTNGISIPKISITAEPDGEPQSPVMPFPTFSEPSGSFSSRPPSLRLPSTMLSSEAPEVNEPLIEDIEEESKRVKWWPYWFLPPPWLLMSTLFPTLYNWRVKRLWEKFLGIVACPSVFLLTITIPLVDPRQSDSESESDMSMESGDESQFRPMVRLPDDSPIIVSHDDPSNHPETQNYGASPMNGARSREPQTHGRPRLDSEMPAVRLERTPATSSLPWHRWLVCIQMFTGPWFVILVAWHNLDTSQSIRSLLILSLSSLVFSLICLAILHLSTRGRTYTQPPNHVRPFLSLLGFLVGICWIASIADEVVSVLKSIGVILNISDSLLGLTIFAVGNSLGDLVADVTVARLGYPVMALSACFGGPMLNILLGIGIGGLYMSLHRPSKHHQHQSQSHIESSSLARSMLAAKETYEITISKTLVISGATLLVILLGLLIIIPLNGWMMDRKIGFGLIALWTVSTIGNVIAEVVT